jgi:cytochrome c oxidase subunit 2
MLAIGVVASIIGVAISLSIDWFPKSASTAAGKIDTLYDVLLICSVPVFVLVMTVAIYSVVKFRAKPGDMSDGAPIHGNTRLEVIWVTIPFLMVTGLAIYAWVLLNDVEAKPKDRQERIVNVVAQQFTWHFQYAKAGLDPGKCGNNGRNQVTTNMLELARDEPVYFRICARDVIHSFWVPEFRLKEDAVPGQVTHIRLRPDRNGTYAVVCAELCGLGHSTMRVPVRVVEQAQFNGWLRQQVAPTQASTTTPSGGGGAANTTAAGKALFASNGCGSCHKLADAGGTGTIGPDLDKLAADAAKYGKQKSQTPEQYVTTSIKDPSAFVVPGFPNGVMPATFGQSLTPDQLNTLVKYLLSVGGK